MAAKKKGAKKKASPKKKSVAKKQSKKATPKAKKAAKKKSAKKKPVKKAVKKAVKKSSPRPRKKTAAKEKAAPVKILPVKRTPSKKRSAVVEAVTELGDQQFITLRFKFEKNGGAEVTLNRKDREAETKEILETGDLTFKDARKGDGIAVNGAGAGDSQYHTNRETLLPTSKESPRKFPEGPIFGNFIIQTDKLLDL